MNADGFRHLYDYHFTANRKVWSQSITALTDEQFVQELPYSVGSIRNQIVHMVSVDDRWFSGLRGVDVPPFLSPEDFPERAAIRERWDAVEGDMRSYLAGLTDATLAQPFGNGDFQVWQVMFHLINHATDHRAQLLSMLNQLGAPTFPQDYAYFLWGRM